MKPINFAINFALAAIVACLILFELALFFELWEKPEWAGKVSMWGWIALAVGFVIGLVIEVINILKRNQEEGRRRRESISKSRQSRKIVKEPEASDK